jgi:OFA family oxalate/formate antiporter-like MFS transporter
MDALSVRFFMLQIACRHTNKKETVILKTANLDRQRWVIFLASCLINLCVGSIYAWSVFATPMAEYLGVKSLAIVFTVANAVGPFTMIPGGSINDRVGPKWIIFIGGLMFGAGMIVCGYAVNTAMMIIGFGLLTGLGLGFVYGCTIGNSVKFFPDHRGLIGGLATASYGLSSVIIPPIASSMIDKMGVTTTFKVLGLIFLVVVCVCAFFIKPCPKGYAPKGWTPPVVRESARIVNEDKTWRGMLSTPVFYVMIIMLTCGAFCGLMLTSQASGMAQNMVNMTPAAAAIVVSVLALFNAAGRICAGFISDKLGRLNTLTVVFVVAVLGLLCLYFSGSSVALFYIGVCIIGVCFGSFMGVFPGFTADRFGAKHNTVNYGIMFIGFAVSGILGPMITSAVYGSKGTYLPAFLIAGIFAIAGFILTFVYRAIEKKKIKA